MYYKFEFECCPIYYIDKNLYTKEQAEELAWEWFDNYIPTVYESEVEEEGE